jgi:hypothetical protein
LPLRTASAALARAAEHHVTKGATLIVHIRILCVFVSARGLDRCGVCAAKALLIGNFVELRYLLACINTVSHNWFDNFEQCESNRKLAALWMLLFWL